MNLAIRKLALIEQNMKEQEERARIEGYSSCPIDRDFKNRITKLMDQVRLI